MSNDETAEQVMIFGINRKFYYAFAGLAALFVIIPQIDLWVSGLFYREGEGFFWAEKDFPQFVYYGVNRVSTALILIFLAYFFISYFFKINLFGIRRKAIAFLLLALMIGPGLVVTTIFKDHWGRARPAHIVQFGGTKEFTPAFIKTDQCQYNCSFVSGHAAFGFYLMTFGFLATGLRRRILMNAGFAIGTIISVGRIVQGRHFLSDVTFAFFFVYFISHTIHWLMYEYNIFEKLPFFRSLDNRLSLISNDIIRFIRQTPARYTLGSFRRARKRRLRELGEMVYDQMQNDRLSYDSLQKISQQVADIDRSIGNVGKKLNKELKLNNKPKR